LERSNPPTNDIVLLLSSTVIIVPFPLNKASPIVVICPLGTYIPEASLKIFPKYIELPLGVTAAQETVLAVNENAPKLTFPVAPVYGT